MNTDTCKYCGVTFTPRYNKMFCSRSCKSKWQWHNRRRDNSGETITRKNAPERAASYRLISGPQCVDDLIGGYFGSKELECGIKDGWLVEGCVVRGRKGRLIVRNKRLEAVR